MNIIFDKIKDSFSRNLPFVAYRKPKSNTVSSFFMKNDILQYSSNFSEAGFVFSPFKDEEKTILFPLEFSDILHEEIQFDENILSKEIEISEDINDKEKYLELVENALSKIDNNSIKKVVVSREKKVEIDNLNLVKTFKDLLKSYANAFVYVWYHPKVGLWFGATPETLLNISNKNFKTMSLAGTQVFNEDKTVVWKSKELEEQQLVTDFVTSQIKEISTNLKVDKTETVKAGNLLHLRTRVEGKLKQNSSLEELIRALHPTPAVCGLPRLISKQFIVDNEHYNRTFYTGFLGEINLEQKSSLFVNLRCMSIAKNTASIYVGGGITKESIPLNEWEETIAKSKTMLKVL